jgi:hypothetical protein
VPARLARHFAPFVGAVAGQALSCAQSDPAAWNTHLPPVHVATWSHSGTLPVPHSHVTPASAALQAVPEGSGADRGQEAGGATASDCPASPETPLEMPELVPIPLLLAPPLELLATPLLELLAAPLLEPLAPPLLELLPTPLLEPLPTPLLEVEPLLPPDPPPPVEPDPPPPPSPTSVPDVNAVPPHAANPTAANTQAKPTKRFIMDLRVPYCCGQFTKVSATQMPPLQVSAAPPGTAPQSP